MTWMDGYSDLKAARERAETAFYAPLGMMSPLWLAFSAAASAGAAFWLLSRFVQPLNIEAVLAPAWTAAPVDVAPSIPEREGAFVEAEADLAQGDAPFVEDQAALSLVETMIEPVVEELAQLEREISDDLTQLAGVGPKIAQALAERGVERFEQLAAWSQQDLEAFDAALDLRGRAIRADFIAQARKLAAGEA